ncbi:hypothetical protein [Leptospira stimsonii]|uniref:Uncharacterized protein n=1 Tax=Leptospira stimsonii TaxID=2202203 RepID=A0ABY2NBU8_9LEPT|nr:hypothetical protein [Leptospira stimsonii]TGK20357.1 hypothetical protein EHO98_09490 [Leptospira stimsonii]TGM20407.1 hypothetical protein EHQ90_02750 [Leptospira stimsonii]
MKSPVRDCDCVLMGLGTADGEDYDGEDEYYPQMIQEETGLTPESARNIYKKKFFAYEKLLESESFFKLNPFILLTEISHS